MYEIRRAGVKGLGVFATSRIPRGARILSERPVLLVDSERDVFAAGRRLSPEHRTEILSLSTTPAKKAFALSWLEVLWHSIAGSDSRYSPRANPDSKPTPIQPYWKSITEYPGLLSVFRNNNFDLGNGLQAMFGDICRINHSCVPSAQGNFNQAIGQFTIHATRPIDADEEITISYLDEHGALRDSRQSKLRDHYGFLCDCPVCDADSVRGRASEGRRVGLHDKLRIFAEEAGDGGEVRGETEFDLTCEMIEMYEAEGLAGRELATMYLRAAELAVKLDKQVDVVRFSNRALEIEKNCLGADNPVLQETEARLGAIRRSLH